MNDDFGSLRHLRELTRALLGSHREKMARIRSNRSPVSTARRTLRTSAKLSGSSRASLS